MSSARHRELLSAFEDDDPVAGLSSKIVSFQQKQKKQSKVKKEHYDWIQTQRNLSDAEAAVSKQIFQASSNVLAYVQKERDFEGLYKACNIDPNLSRAMSLLAEVKHADHGVASLGENTAASLDELDDTLTREIDEQREKVMRLLDDQSNATRHCLPHSLSKELTSLRAMLQANHFLGDCGEIDRLESDLRRSLEDVRRNYDSATISSQTKAHEFKKKCQEIEKNGLTEVGRLRMEFDEICMKRRSTIENDLKRKETHLRLQALRLEREEVQLTETERQLKDVAKKVGDDCENEVKRTQRMLEAKESIMNHQARQLQVGKSNNLQDDFAVEIESLRNQRANMERTNYRQEEMKSKMLSQRKAEDEDLEREASRQIRLNNLAASVPYYKDIMNKSSDIHKTTEARKQDVYGGRSKLADFQSGRLKSFTNEKVFSNANFRLGHALHEAGVANSAYARDAVRNAIPRVEARTTGIKPF